jgi:hypothetical protein
MIVIALLCHGSDRILVLRRYGPGWPSITITNPCLLDDTPPWKEQNPIGRQTTLIKCSISRNPDDHSALTVITSFGATIISIVAFHHVDISYTHFYS